MQLQTVLKRASIGLLAGMAMISQVQAADLSKNDNLMCAAYMDIAVEDLYPLKAIPYEKAKQMLGSRFMRLASVSVSTNQPISTVVDSFIESRNKARVDLIKTSQLNAMRLYTEREIYAYAQSIDKKTSQHCLKGNASYEALTNGRTVEQLTAMAVEVSNEFKKHGEK